VWALIVAVVSLVLSCVALAASFAEHIRLRKTAATVATVRVPDPDGRCMAHGRTVAEHVNGYEHDCTEPPAHAGRAGQCPDCAWWEDTGMHWDSCPQRGRHRGLTPDQHDWGYTA
jgi:hypothetical protein